ncbi:unnamed protein product [Clavelina lepadiformis]|uniref:C-type lectin domain-containing protein n=1 Tax=Clavelina lepadiformis TaxID=159417 RepID=A0ABP0F885_CLALP
MFDRCFSTKRIVLFVAIEALFHFITLIQAGCQTNVLQSGNLLYVLSKDQREFVAASNQCVAMGGKLSNIEGPRVDYISKMNSIYRTKDLTTVEIYEYGVNSKYLINGYDGYGSKDTSFPKFKLYTTPKSAYNAKFVFCKASYNWYYDLYQKWSVQNTSCINGWSHDFTLYGGEKDRGTKPVYRYHNSQYSVRLSLSDEPSGDFTTRYPTLYIPDIRVQTGIQSDVNQSDWLSDNQVINSFPFDLPRANKDKCQQLSLRYNDVDWVASAVDCGTTTAYYHMCQINFSIQVKPIQCNGTSIIVSWNPNLYKNIFPEASKFPVRVYVKDVDHKSTFTAQGKIIFSNLKPRTQYRINAYVWPCSSAIKSNYVYVTTSYGKPDAIATAYVVSQPGSGICTIDWPRDYHNGNITSYEIVANNQFNSSIKINVTSWLFEMGSSNNRSTRYTIPSELLTIYGYSKNISFQIIAYSCEGASIPMSVNGYCVVVPDEVPPTASPRVEISVVVLPVVGLLLLFAIVGLLGYRK